MKRRNYIFLVMPIAIMTLNTSCESKSYGTAQGIYESSESDGNAEHIDDDYKNESRTGTSGNYEYNYDVSGDGVEGNVDMHGKYGSGTITDEYGNDKDVDVEWVDYGVMEATDEDGNTYTMEAD